jgi:hypothetical protein
MLALRNQIGTAENIRGALAENARDYELAIEAESLAVQQHKIASQNYDDAEAEFLSILYADGRIDGKTAEIRKAQADAALVSERHSGHLHLLWRMLLDAENAMVNAKMTREQFGIRYGATKHAADLTAAILLAAVR